LDSTIQWKAIEGTIPFKYKICFGMTAEYFYDTFAYDICFYGIYFYGIYIYGIYIYKALAFLNIDCTFVRNT
jgi:hypothetical protein